MNDHSYVVEIDGRWGRPNYWVIFWPGIGCDMKHRYKTEEAARKAMEAKKGDE